MGVCMGVCAGFFIACFHAQPLVAGGHASGLRRAAVQHVGEGDEAVFFAGAQAQRLCGRGRLARGGDAVGGQQLGHGQLLRAVHPGGQFGGEAAAGQLLQGGGNVAFGHGAGFAAPPEQAHGVIERGGLFFAAQAQVKAQGHERAFGVVADGGVGGVGFGAVVLHPGVKAGFGHGLHVAAGRLPDLVERLGQQFQVGGAVNQARAQQQQVVVVAGEAFKEPQQARVVFLPVVVAGEFGRAQAFDVPGVKVLVADEAQQGGVALAGVALPQARQVAPGADERRAAAVLQPAVAAGRGVEHEKVVRLRRLAARAVPQAGGGLADFLRVAQQALAVK